MLFVYYVLSVVRLPQLDWFCADWDLACSMLASVPENVESGTAHTARFWQKC
jgi:hypothetical protein